MEMFKKKELERYKRTIFEQADLNIKSNWATFKIILTKKNFRKYFYGSSTSVSIIFALAALLINNQSPDNIFALFLFEEIPFVFRLVVFFLIIAAIFYGIAWLLLFLGFLLKYFYIFLTSSIRKILLYPNLYKSFKKEFDSKNSANISRCLLETNRGIVIDFYKKDKTLKEASFEVHSISGKDWNIGILLMDKFCKTEMFKFHPLIRSESNTIKLAIKNIQLKDEKVTIIPSNTLDSNNPFIYKIRVIDNEIRCFISNLNNKEIKELKIIDRTESIKDDYLHYVRFQFWKGIKDNEIIKAEAKNINLLWE